MKRTLLSVILAFCLVCSAAFGVHSENTPSSLPFTLYTFGVEPEASTLFFTLQAENHQNKSMTCKVYSVVENPDGSADSCRTHTLTLQPGVNYLPLTHTYENAGEGKQLKLYCWNTAMQPLTKPIIKQIDFKQTVTSLTVSPENPVIYLTGGKTTTLTVSHAPQNLPAPRVQFESGDPSVVTVSEKGTLTPLSAGNATIRVVNADRTAFTTCKVLVVTHPTTLQLNTASLSVEVDEQFTLTPTVAPSDAPNKKVLYSVKDSSVATVSEKGVVKGVKVGTTTVTATMADGSATATCTVTVTPAVLGVTLNQQSVNMWDYGMYTLKATVKGGDGNKKVIWKSSNDLVATVSDSGIVFGVGKGEATITATAGTVTASCKVKVYREYDYTGTIAAHFESKDNPGNISGSGTGKSYGCFQLHAGSNGPKNFYTFLIEQDFRKDIGLALKAAHEKDGGKDKVFGENFDKVWKDYAANEREEFRSCQMAYCMSHNYEPIVNKLITELNFYPDNYSLALKSALWSRSIQHGVGGAFNRIKQAFSDIGGWEGKSEKELITAIYKECGKVVDSPPYDTSVPMNENSSIAVEYGLVGKYMKYYSSSSSSMQAGVWKRLNVTELQMLYDLMETPPVIITPQK